ncbi:MAG: FprA family A-type flavoprotein [Bacteroidetes bacterium]|nr:FprA family A-type flavoprotein [Bacteroidota bacterium]MCL5025704.1 FprA family A-type flavoprotein [Chloroflexota bacterium]
MQKQVAPGITRIGLQAWDERVFDALIALPYGTSYNAYLVQGGEKTALIDTARMGFETELLGQVSALTPLAELDYLVMNHAEPDHTSAIPQVLAAAPRARLLLTQPGRAAVQALYQVEDDRITVVKEGDTVDLGGKSLRFVDAPFLHWPETMFTYCPEEAVLFSCDFMGSHIAADLPFADQVGGIVLPEAKRYYAQIMMPFARPAARAMDKIAALDPKPRLIAPSHGPPHRRPEVILQAYEQWVRGPLLPKIVVAYISMWSSTATLAQEVADAASAEGVEVIPRNLQVADLSHVACDLVDASALVVGSPTVLGGPHPAVAQAMTLIKAIRPRLKLAAAFGSYGWSGGAVKAIGDMAKAAGMETVDTLEVKGRPHEADLAAARALGRRVAQAVLSATKGQ